MRIAEPSDAPPKELVKCARPGCAVQFIPRAKTHLYCSSKCKQRVVAYRFALNGGGRLWPAGERPTVPAGAGHMPG